MKRKLQIVVLLTLLFVSTPLVKAANAFPVLVSQTGPCPGGTTGNISLTPTGGTAPFTFHWNDGSPLQNRTNLSTGNYAVTITDNTGAIDTFSFNISVPAAYHFTKSIVNEKCGGQNIGSVTFNVTGATAPYTFSWNNGDTTQNLAHLTAAVYYVTVTDAHGCSAIDSANVTQPPGVGINASITNASCGANNGSASLTVLYGNPAYTYLWNDGDTAQNRTGLAAGTYTITVTDSIGCSASATEVIPQSPGSMSVNSTSTQPSCFGGNNGSINITSVVGSTGPFSYFWNDSTTSPNKTGLFAGSYTVTITSGTGCTISSSFNISQPTQINVTLTPISLTCYGSANGGITTSVNGGTPSYHYNWGGGITSQNRINLPSGNYTVTVTDNKGCADTASVFVDQPTQVNVNVTSTGITCAGGPSGSVTANASGGAGGYSYWWGAGVTTQTKSNVNAGTYTVTVTDANGCTASASGTVAAYTPVSLSSTQVNNICYGTSLGSINLIPNNGAGPFSYIWNTGDTTKNIDSLAAGTYSVTVTDAHTCTASKSVTITQSSFPITVNSTIADVICHGDSSGAIIISPINGNPPYNYLWNDGSTFKTLSNLPIGNYSLTVTDNSGCSAGMTFTITQPQAITINHTDNNITCFGTNNGKIQLGVTGGYAPYTYAWSDGPTTQNRSNLAAGTYIVTVSDHYGCKAEDTSVIIQPGKVIIDTTVTNVDCYGANTGAVNLVVSGGTSPYTYNWGGGITTPNRLNLTSGTYHVTVTDNAGCTATNLAIVSQPSAPLNITSTVINATCSGGNNGAINLNVTGGTTPYSFNWGGGVVSQNLSNLSSGTYILNASDNAGCFVVDTFTVSQATTLNVSAVVVNAGCNGAAGGSVTLTVTGGAPNYTYDWGGGITSQNRTNLIAGTYTVTVTDNAGCSKIVSSTVTQSGSISISSVVANVNCFGGNTGNINITVSGGTSPYTYNWGGGITSQNRTNLAAGSYSVTVTDNIGCTLSNASAVTQPTQLNVIPAITDVTCSGGNNGSIHLSVNGGAPAYTYSWTGGITSQNLDSLTASDYIVAITDANSCIVVDTFTVGEPGMLSVGLTPVNIGCNGQSSGSITSHVAGGTPVYAYNWSNNFSSPNLTNIDTGSYSLTVTDINFCTAIASAVITQAEPLVISSSVINSTCYGSAHGAISTIVSGGTGSYYYLWSDSSSNQDLMNISAGNYMVTVSDDNACSVSASIPVTQPAPIGLNFTIDNVSCAGGNNGSVLATVTGGTGNYTYAWANGATTDKIDTLAAGVYTIVVKDSAKCSVSASANISEPAQIIINENVANVSCAAPNSGSINLSVTGGVPAYSYAWNTGDSTSAINNLTVNTYAVTVTDSSLCTVATSINVAQSPGLSLNVTSTNYECVNKKGTININISGGSAPFVYNWADGASSQNRAALAVGNYLVTVTDAGSCSASTSATINQIASLVSNITKIDVTCYGGNNGSAHLDVTNGTPPYNILWSNGADKKDIINLIADTFNVTVTDANNCNISNVTVINQPVQIQLSETVKPVNCYGNNDGAINTNVIGGTAAYVYHWNNNAVSQNLANLSAGTYALTVTDSSNCSVTANNIVVSQPTQITATTDVTPAGCSGLSNGAIQMNVNGGAAPYSFLWSNLATTQSLNSVAAGNYDVTITDSKSCTTVVNASVISSSPLNIVPSVRNTSCNEVQNGSITLLVTGGKAAYSYNWSNGAHSENLTALSSGSYAVTITDANGCSSSNDFTITSDYELEVHITPPAVTTIIPGQSVELIATTNVNHCNAYSWASLNKMSCSTCATTEILAEETGLYTISVIDVNGCKAIDTITLDVNTHPDIYIPNAFSPNNDGNNDEFKIYGVLDDIVRIDFSIFDRWGEEVFETNNAHTGWNGTFKGEPAPVGVYVYMIKLNLSNGSIKNYKGAVTLIK